MHVRERQTVGQREKGDAEVYLGCPGGSEGKESACSAGDLGSIPGLGRSPGEGNSYPLQYSCLENSMERGVWQAAAQEVAKGQTQLSNFQLLTPLRFT